MLKEIEAITVEAKDAIFKITFKNCEDKYYRMQLIDENRNVLEEAYAKSKGKRDQLVKEMTNKVCPVPVEETTYSELCINYKNDVAACFRIDEVKNDIKALSENIENAQKYFLQNCSKIGKYAEGAIFISDDKIVLDHKTEKYETVNDIMFVASKVCSGKVVKQHDDKILLISRGRVIFIDFGKFAYSVSEIAQKFREMRRQELLDSDIYEEVYEAVRQV